MTITTINTLKMTPEVITVAPNNYVLNSLSSTNLVLTGDAAGQIVTLPSALSLDLGWTFFVRNESSQLALVKTFQGQTLATVRAGQRAELYLYSTASVNGLWSVLTTGNINDTKVGSTLDLLFCSSGVTSDRWLGSGQWINYSNESPTVVPLGGPLTALSYSNLQVGSSIDLEFYKNGLLAGNKVFTWAIRSKKLAYKTSSLDSLVFAPGDTLSILARTLGGSDPRPISISLQVWLRVTSPLSSEGGSYA